MLKLLQHCNYIVYGHANKAYVVVVVGTRRGTSVSTLGSHFSIVFRHKKNSTLIL